MRITRVYTRTGDNGNTALVGGKSCSKKSLRIHAYGTVDELNSSLGLARTFNQAPLPDANPERDGKRQLLEEILAAVQVEQSRRASSFLQVGAREDPTTPQPVATPEPAPPRSVTKEKVRKKPGSSTTTTRSTWRRAGSGYFGSSFKTTAPTCWSAPSP